MKRNVRIALAVVLVALFGINAQAQSWKDILSGAVKTIVGDKATTAKSIYGTWKYEGPDCQFESDDLLAKAGGLAASSKVEEELGNLMKKYKLEGTSYTFNEDGTYTATTMRGGKTSGTFTFDEKEKTITMTTRLGLKTTAHVSVNGSEMSLLFNADKLMSGLKLVTSLTSKLNSTASLINSLAGKYDGMKLGMKLKKAE